MFISKCGVLNPKASNLLNQSNKLINYQRITGPALHLTGPVPVAHMVQPRWDLRNVFKLVSEKIRLASNCLHPDAYPASSDN